MTPPFLVAHRAGNDLARLRRAETLGIPVIEADVHLFAGRLEVRHLKTVGPLPILWDRWALAPPWTPRLLLRRLLAASTPATHLMLDLKGRDLAVAQQVARALDDEGAARPITICAREWRLLAAFADRRDVRCVHSVGNARQMRRLLREEAPYGVSIHRRLLDASVVRELKARARVVMSFRQLPESPDRMGVT